MTTVRLKLEIEVLADVDASGEVSSVREPSRDSLLSAAAAAYTTAQLAEMVSRATGPRLDEGLVRVWVGLGRRDIEYHRLVRTTATQLVLHDPIGRREERWSRRNGRHTGPYRGFGAPSIHAEDLAELNKGKPQ